MSRVRVAIVGAGGIANRHAYALRANERAELTAVIDADRAKSEDFAARWGGTVYDSLSGCLGEVDAVYVLTPPTVRKGYALEALSAGKHLFCEKPLASTSDDALEITRAAERANVVSVMGLNMRYRTGFDLVRRTVHDGKLGHPYHFWRQRFGSGPGATGTIKAKNWRTDPAFVVGMTVESFSHDADLLRWIMRDEVQSVSAVVYGTVAALPEFDNNAYALFRTKQGASATITASWSSRIGFNDCGVLGETGTAFVSGTAPGNNGIWCSREFHIRTDEDEHELVEMIHDDLDDASYVREAEDFVSAIIDGTEPRTSIRDGFETLRISEAVLESSRTNATVTIEQTPS